MPIALSAAAMIPAAGEIGAAFGPVGLAIAAVAIVGCIAYEAGFFDWLGDVLEDGWDWLKNGFGKVVQKAKSVVQENIIPGVLDGIDWICKAMGVKGKGKTNQGKEDTDRKQKKPKKGTGKEKADDIPSWTKGNKPYEDENGKDFAERLCDEHYGKGNYSTKGQSDYSKIGKWGGRGFE